MSTPAMATFIRNTKTWEFSVDDAVAAKGHKDCGGWSLTHAEDVLCLHCDEFLFHLSEVVSR